MSELRLLLWSEIVNFPFWDYDVPCRASYGVYISQLIRFARVCTHVAFNVEQPNFSSRGIGIINFEKHFRHYELISKVNLGLNTLLREGFPEPEFYGDLVYKFKKPIGRNDFYFQFRKTIYLHVTDV